MLISGKAKFDVLIANINSPDLHGFKLLQQAANMGLPTIVMANDDNTHMAMRALEFGAFLYVKKPLTMEILKCLWQHVLREKTSMIRERNILQNPNNSELMMMNKNKGKSKKSTINRDNIEEFEYEHLNRATNNNNVKGKMCTEWTQELHAKFMAVVDELGEGKCFPKDILELMNVPGLTRMQVASHLQKCRNDKWRSPFERKSQQAAQPVLSDPNGPMPKPRKFGSKPFMKTYSAQSNDFYSPKQGSEAQYGDEIPNTNGTPLSIPPMTNASDNYHQQLHFELMGPDFGTSQLEANYINHRHSADKFFSFHDVDCLVQNFPGFSNEFGLNHFPSAYNFTPTYHDQNSGESKSNWSPNTSNFERDQSAETGVPE
ncbi:two-component response regulator ARR2 [Striga asiatica]|uniref:Two-component response regulator ARR2 n=1 Tax=Striga asiatica TaxID=4170 RepID=A0A5A7QIC6_STRAF|nr:two-component response regulator ARR2 [Striga asiatica]